MGKKALYLQISEKLRELINSGELKTNSKLSQRNVAGRFNTSRKTASEALDILEAEGLVIATPRSGTVVSNNAWLLLSDGTAPDWNSYVESGIQLPSKEKIFRIMRDLSSGRHIHVSGPRVGKHFGYTSAINKSLPHVMKRLETTNDLNDISIFGLPSLRETLSKRLASYGIKATPDEIMITTGMTESLAIISWAFLRCGMTFIHDTPSILNSMQLVRSSGANIVRVPLDNYGMLTEPLGKVLKNTARTILYINPVNQYPTGISYSKTRRNRIMSMCAHAGVPVVENDMLREFWLKEPHPRPMKAFDKSGLVIYVGCTIGVNIGFKLSWIVAPRNIISRLSDVKTQYDTNTNTFIQIAADELFKNGYYDEFLEQSRPLFYETLNRAYDVIEKNLDGLIHPLIKKYGYYIWVTFIEEIDIVKVYDNCETIMFLPGYFFDNTNVHGLHLAPFADTIEHFEKAVKTIAEKAKIQLSEN